MRRSTMGFILASSLLLAGCGGASGGGTLDITENGTYDVSGYDKVVVNVGGEAQEDAGIAPTESGQGQSLNLTRVQLRGFSMEVPANMVEGYTDAELTENDSVHFRVQNDDGSSFADLSTVGTSAAGARYDIGLYNDGPQEEVNGINMAVKHSHSGNLRIVQVDFINAESLYTVQLMYSVDADDLYAEYADQFYRTIQVN